MPIPEPPDEQSSGAGVQQKPPAASGAFDLERYLASSECLDEFKTTLNAAARRFAARRFAILARVNWRLRHDSPQH